MFLKTVLWLSKIMPFLIKKNQSKQYQEKKINFM